MHSYQGHCLHPMFAVTTIIAELKVSTPFWGKLHWKLSGKVGDGRRKNIQAYAACPVRKHIAKMEACWPLLVRVHYTSVNNCRIRKIGYSQQKVKKFEAQTQTAQANEKHVHGLRKWRCKINRQYPTVKVNCKCDVYLVFVAAWKILNDLPSIHINTHCLHGFHQASTFGR